MFMHVEVDQSGKIEQTNWDTVLAMSDGVDYAILIPAAVKREVFHLLRGLYPERAGEFHIYQFFAVGLYLLMSPYLDELEEVGIDREYEGKEGYIKGILLQHLRRDDPDFPSAGIGFRRVGKGSPSDALAYSVFQGERPPDTMITLEEIMDVVE